MFSTFLDSFNNYLWKDHYVLHCALHKELVYKFEKNRYEAWPPWAYPLVAMTNTDQSIIEQLTDSSVKGLSFMIAKKQDLN